MELALQVIAGKKLGATRVDIPIELYKSDDTASIDAWLAAHSDGIP